MNNFICTGCGTKYQSPELTPPPGIRWTDGHVCTPKLVEPKSEANEADLIQEIKKVLYESAKKTEMPSGGFEINIQFEEQAKALINQFTITRNNK